MEAGSTAEFAEAATAGAATAVAATLGCLGCLAGAAAAPPEVDAEAEGAGLADFATLGAGLTESTLGADAAAVTAEGVAADGVPDEEVEEATLAIVVIDWVCCLFILLV